MNAKLKRTMPRHLHAAFDWTDAAGELDELASLPSRSLEAYCRESAANNALEGDGDVTQGDLRDLHRWLSENEYRSANRPTRGRGRPPKSAEDRAASMTVRLDPEYQSKRDAIIGALECSTTEAIRFALDAGVEKLARKRGRT